MKKVVVWGIVLAVTSVLWAGVAPGHVQAQGLSAGCQALNGSRFDGDYSYQFLDSESFYQGEVITAIVSVYGGSTSPLLLQSQTLAQLFVDAPMVDSTTVPGSMSYTIPADDVHEVTFSISDESIVTWDVSCGLPATTVVVPGCDALINIPSDAVVGAFVSDTLAFWAPDLSKATAPPVVLKAGATAWVLGPDDTNQFYEIIWACQYLWVPVSTMGPNFDEVWQGRPLPGGLGGPGSGAFEGGPGSGAFE